MQPPGAKYRYEEIVIRMLNRLRDEGVLTDVNPGSVTRTLVEAFALELAQAHAQLAQIYEMGYVDTATGDSLDLLVALLGQKRADGQQVVGDAVFARQEKIAGRVVIPQGTRLDVTLTGASGTIPYKTAQEAELQAGQSEVTVRITADLTEGTDPATCLLPEGGVWTVTQATPLAGVGQVTIPRPTARRGHRETDDDLRSRVKGLIAAAGGGTLKAMEAAILATGVARGVVFRDANSGGNPKLSPGVLEVMVDGAIDSAEVNTQIMKAINQTKGPGILVSLGGVNTRSIAIHLKVLPGAPDLSAAKRQSLRRTIEQTVQAALEGLRVGESLLWNPLQAKVLSLDGVRDILEQVVKVDDVKLDPLPREIPAGGLSPMERLVPAEGQAVSVAFAGEGKTLVRLFTVSDPAPAVRASVARAVEGLLAAKNEAGGGAALSFTEVQTAVRDALQNAEIAIQITDLIGGGVSTLRSGQSHAIGSDDRFEPHPDGPVWGRLP